MRTGFDILNELYATEVLAPRNLSRTPPYNLIKVDEDTVRLEFALAGYAKDEIQVEVSPGLLTISANTSIKDHAEIEYIYKGISRASNLKKVLKLHPDAVVQSVKYNNGILAIDVQKVIPEEKKPRILTIE